MKVKVYFQEISQRMAEIDLDELKELLGADEENGTNEITLPDVEAMRTYPYPAFDTEPGNELGEYLASQGYEIDGSVRVTEMVIE